LNALVIYGTLSSSFSHSLSLSPSLSASALRQLYLPGIPPETIAEDSHSKKLQEKKQERSQTGPRLHRLIPSGLMASGKEEDQEQAERKGGREMGGR
jgi:hypothetical protein